MQSGFDGARELSVRIRFLNLIWEKGEVVPTGLCRSRCCACRVRVSIREASIVVHGAVLGCTKPDGAAVTATGVSCLSAADRHLRPTLCCRRCLADAVFAGVLEVRLDFFRKSWFYGRRRGRARRRTGMNRLPGRRVACRESFLEGFVDLVGFRR
jgi:hypothetical protein